MSDALQGPIVRPGVAEYAKRVGRYLGDQPKAVRDETVADLANRLAESGEKEFAVCIEKYGKPRAYAAELREGMDLGPTPPWWRRRGTAMPVFIAGALVAAVIAGVVVDRVRQLPDDFNPFTSGISTSGPPDRFDTIGSVLVVTPGSETVDGYFSFVLTNSSDVEVEVLSIEVPFMIWTDDGGIMVGGFPDVASESIAGFVARSDELWQERIALDPMGPDEFRLDPADPTHTAFESFSLAPGETYGVHLTGELASCPRLSESLGGGVGAIRATFTARGRQFDARVYDLSFDLSDCPITE
jgi:hypothetical protein